MKKIAISIIVFLTAALTAAAQKKFILEGTADIEQGIVEVWRHEYECARDSTDLIATAEVKGGWFRIEADAPGAVVCRVYRTDKVGWWPVFLEPGVKTTSNMGGAATADTVFDGGANQRVFNEFLVLHRAAYKRYTELLSGYGGDLDGNFDEIRPRANVILRELSCSLDDFFVRYGDTDAAAYVLYVLSYGADIGYPDVADLKAKLRLLGKGPRNGVYGERVAATVRRMESE